MNRVYIAFLHALCASDYQILVHHFFWDLRDEAIADLVRRIERAEPSTRFSILTKRDLKRMDLPGKAAPYNELALATRSREALELLFGSGDIYIGFEEWLLGHQDKPFPLDFMRRRYFRGDQEGPGLLQSAVGSFPASIQIREFHGPLISTCRLSEESITAAAYQTSLELGYRLRFE